jgi:cell division protein FtsB
MNLAARRLTRGLLLGIAVYYVLWGGEYSAFDLRSLENRQQEETVRLVQVRSEVDSLQALAERLENDPATIERVARERFGMIRGGEVLYRFVEVEAPPSAGSRLARTP